MNNIILYVIILIFLIPIVIIWVNGIDKMKKEHPDYKGEDFLNTDNE